MNIIIFFNQDLLFPLKLKCTEIVAVQLHGREIGKVSWWRNRSISLTGYSSCLPFYQKETKCSKERRNNLQKKKEYFKLFLNHNCLLCPCNNCEQSYTCVLFCTSLWTSSPLGDFKITSANAISNYSGKLAPRLGLHLITCKTNLDFQHKVYCQVETFTIHF